MKYHIKKDGTVGPCHAKNGNCPLGGPENHFDTPEQAQQTAQAKMEQEQGFGFHVDRENNTNIVSLSAVSNSLIKDFGKTAEKVIAKRGGKKLSENEAIELRDKYYEKVYNRIKNDPQSFNEYAQKAAVNSIEDIPEDLVINGQPVDSYIASGISDTDKGIDKLRNINSPEELKNIVNRNYRNMTTEKNLYNIRKYARDKANGFENTYFPEYTKDVEPTESKFYAVENEDGSVSVESSPYIKQWPAHGKVYSSLKELKEKEHLEGKPQELSQRVPSYINNSKYPSNMTDKEKEQAETVKQNTEKYLNQQESTLDNMFFDDPMGGGPKDILIDRDKGTMSIQSEPISYWNNHQKVETTPDPVIIADNLKTSRDYTIAKAAINEHLKSKGLRNIILSDKSNDPNIEKNKRLHQLDNTIKNSKDGIVPFYSSFSHPSEFFGTYTRNK